MERLRALGLLKLNRKEFLYGTGVVAGAAAGTAAVIAAKSTGLLEWAALYLEALQESKEKVPGEEKVLGAYPFKGGLGVELIEGWIYDGNLGDPPGELHYAVDYVRRDPEGSFIPFNVYSMARGEAYQGENIEPDGGGWGKYVKVITPISQEKVIVTTFAHLDEVNESIPWAVRGIFEPRRGLLVNVGDFLGIAGTTGDTRGVAGNLEGQIQLHVELWKVQKIGGFWAMIKVDPYGVEGRLNSGKYRQPGQSLAGLNHYFSTDNPFFAK